MMTLLLKGFTRGLSYLMHPLVLPVCSFLFLTTLPGYHAIQVAPFREMLLVLVFLFTFLIPVLLMGILRSAGRIRSFQMEERGERTLPYLVTGIAYYLAYRYFLRMGLPSVYALVLLSATAMILVALIVNLRWKVSIHMMGVGGALGMMHGLAGRFPGEMFGPTVVLLVLAGLLAFSRLYLGSHRQGEVYGGFLAGYLLFLVTFSMLT
jgi:membrane-associated phospholipid phosphatase